jgi:predicted HTH transcriptional regulator
MATQIQATIAQGEGPTIEFKEDTPDNKEQMLKTMAAFANGEGGIILLGVKAQCHASCHEVQSRRQEKIEHELTGNTGIL